MLKSLIKSKTGLLGMIIILSVIFMALFATVLSPYDPNTVDVMNKYLDPIWCADSLPQYLLGTDALGRDIFSRILYGSRVSLIIAFLGTIVGIVVGVSLGAISGYFGKWVDSLIMRLVDMQLSFPFVLIAVFIANVLDPGIKNVVIIAALSSWVRYARLVRGEILAIKEMEYVEAIRSLGGSHFRIIFKHILPNVISPIIVLATLEVAKIILMEASLSYLGVGIPVTIPTWGRMLADGRDCMLSAPWLAILPGICITVTVLGVNLLGDWLRDYLDPKLDI